MFWEKADNTDSGHGARRVPIMALICLLVPSLLGTEDLQRCQTSHSEENLRHRSHSIDRQTQRRPSRSPGLKEALSHLREADTLVVWKLDRLSRSVKGAGRDLLHQAPEPFSLLRILPVHLWFQPECRGLTNASEPSA
jgi:hypothetical protein